MTNKRTAIVFGGSALTQKASRTVIIAGGLALLGSCGGGGGGAGSCRPPAPLPAGQTCGPVNTGVQPQSSADCGPWGAYTMEEGRCQGTANACCTDPADCWSGECIDGACSSTGVLCVCDTDCTLGAVCVGGTCIKLPGAPCSLTSECSACFDGACVAGACPAGGVCGCGNADYADIGPACRSSSDCCNGACVSGQCLRAAEGGSCTTEADCARGACVAGACRCLAAGSVALTDVFNPGCCSGAVVGGMCGA
jgi:hypothetical protein